MNRKTEQFLKEAVGILSSKFKITEKKDGWLHHIEAEGPCYISMCFFAPGPVLLEAEIDGKKYEPLNIIYTNGISKKKEKKYLDNLEKILYEIRNITKEK